MVPCRACIDDSNLHTLAEVSPGVKLAHASGVVRRVIPCSYIIWQKVRRRHSQWNEVVPPNTLNAGKLLQGVYIVSLRLNTGAGEDIAIKRFDNFDIIVLIVRQALNLSREILGLTEHLFVT